MTEPVGVLQYLAEQCPRVPVRDFDFYPKRGELVIHLGAGALDVDAEQVHDALADYVPVDVWVSVTRPEVACGGCDSSECDGDCSDDGLSGVEETLNDN